MRRVIPVVLGLSITLLFSMFAVYAGDVQRMKVNVEFPFKIYDNTLPAGEYWVELRAMGGTTATGSLLAFVGKDESHVVFPTTRTIGNLSNNSEAYLAFNKVGDSYFLSKVHQHDIEVSFSKTRNQKEMEMAYAKKTQMAAIKNVKVKAIK